MPAEVLTFTRKSRLFSAHLLSALMTECQGAEEEGHFHVNPPYDHGKGEHRLMSSQTCICACRSGQEVVSGQPLTSSVLFLCLPFIRHFPELRSSTLALSLARIFWSSSCGLALGRQSGRGPQFSGTPLGAPWALAVRRYAPGSPVGLWLCGGTPLRALWGSGCSVVHPREPRGALAVQRYTPEPCGALPILESWMRTSSECVCSQPQRTGLGSPHLWESQLAGIREWQSLNQALSGFRALTSLCVPSGC